MKYPIENLHSRSSGPGRVKRVRTADFMDGVLPSWITTVGTASVASPATTVGYAQVTTAATIADTATIQSELSVAPSQIEAVLFEVEGFMLDAHNPVADILIDFRASGAGVYAIQRSTESFMRIGVSGDTAGTETPTPLNLRGGIQAANNTPKNFGFLWQCRTRELFLFAEDDLVGYRLMSTFPNNPTTKPKLSIVARDAVARNMRVKQIRQTVWVN